MASGDDELRNRAIGMLYATRRNLEELGDFLEPNRINEMEADLETIAMLLPEASTEELEMIVRSLETEAWDIPDTMYGDAPIKGEPFQTIIGWKRLEPEFAHQTIVTLWGTRHERDLSDHRVLLNLVLEFSNAHPPMQSVIRVWWTKSQRDIQKQEHTAHQLEEFIHLGFALEKEEEVKAGVRFLFDARDSLLLNQNRWQLYLRLGLVDALKNFPPYPYEADLLQTAVRILALSDPLVRIHHHFRPIFDALRAIERDDLINDATQHLKKNVPESDWQQVAETLGLGT